MHREREDSQWVVNGKAWVRMDLDDLDTAARMLADSPPDWATGEQRKMMRRNSRRIQRQGIRMKKTLHAFREGLPDPTAWDALYQQNPVPQSGNKFERGHWRRANTSDLDIIDRFRAWDLASSENKGDYTVGALLGRTRDRRTVILDIIRGQWGPDRVEREILDAADRDGMEARIRMEIPKGESGVTLLHYGNLLHHRDFDGWNVKGKKEDRAQVMSGSHKKGKLIIPDNAPWAETLIAEFERFPYGTHDDQVDACALAFNQLWEYGGGDTMMTIPADAEAVMSLTAGFQPPEELVEYAGHLPAPWVELADQPG